MSMFTPPANHSCKFEAAGDTHLGEIVEISERLQATKYGTTDPSFWPSGDPMMQVKITLQTDERDPEDPTDDGKRGLWVLESGKQGGLLWAIREAVKKSGADDLREGGRLQVTFTGTDPESKNPQNPRKLYQAVYQGPAAGGGMFGDTNQAPATTAENQMGQPAPQQAPAAPQQAPAQQAGAYGQQGFPVDNQPAPAQDPAPGMGQFNNGQHTQQAPAQQAPNTVDADTESRIKQLLAMNVDTTSIVNAIGNPAVTGQVVDTYRNAAA
ncbi:hypothetical protein ACIGDM_10445 [Rothia koreensis]|uniref:hypothetical protein n=1 Tax=Rothia koreensis TaxID=592378 RepID=UPI0037CBFF40